MLYTGITNNLIKRIAEPKLGIASQFTKQYGVHKLVYFDFTNDVNEAILMEKKLKKWKREWKNKLISNKNPDWKDLYQDIVSY